MFCLVCDPQAKAGRALLFQYVDHVQRSKLGLECHATPKARYMTACAQYITDGT